MDNPDCVILCGGLGTRLRSVIGDTPKVMAKVDGRPFLDIVIEYLKEQDIQRIVLCTGYKADVIEHYYREHDFGLTIDFSREREALGTGGALKNAREIILSNPFFVLNGDSFLPADLQSFLEFHKGKNSVASILVTQVKVNRDFGSVRLDETDRITDFCEKTGDNTELLVNAGVYCFDQSVFSFMPGGKRFSLETDLFPKLAGSQFYGYRIDKEFIDIGTPEKYTSVKRKLKKGNNIGNQNG